MDKPWYVYVVYNPQSPEKIYTGCTPRPKHRLEAHAGKRSGGARTTSHWKGNVAMAMLIGPLETHNNVKGGTRARMLEARFKKTRIAKKSGITGRCLAVLAVLEKYSWATTARTCVALAMSKEEFQQRCGDTQIPASMESMFLYNQRFPIA